MSRPTPHTSIPGVTLRIERDGAPTRASGGIDVTGTDTVAWQDLTGFQRDVLLSLASLDGQDPSGRRVGERLEAESSDPIVWSRVYQALDALVALDLVEKRHGTGDARRNVYSLRHDAYRLLDAHADQCARILGAVRRSGGQPGP